MFESLNDRRIGTLLRNAGDSGLRGDLVNSPDLSVDWHSKIIGKVMGHPVLGGALRLINPILARLAHPPEPEFAFTTAAGNRANYFTDPAS